MQRCRQPGDFSWGSPGCCWGRNDGFCCSESTSGSIIIVHVLDFFKTFDYEEFLT